MSIVFPSKPSNNQVFISGSRQYIWNNAYGVWKSSTLTGTYNFTSGNTIPTNPNAGDRWYNTDYGTELVYVLDPDGSSSQWVEITGGQTGFTGYTGSTGYIGSIGYVGSIGSLGYTGSAGLSSAVTPAQGNSQQFTATGTSDTFILGSTLANTPDAVVSINGLVLTPSIHYNYISYTNQPAIQFTTTPRLNDLIEVRTFVGGVGYTGSLGQQGPAGGYTGSQGSIGFVGSIGGLGYTGSIGYTGSSAQYLSANALSQFFVSTGATTTFALSTSVANQNNIIVTMDGLVQSPVFHYTITGSVLAFTSIPPLNSIIEVRNFESGTGGSGSGSISKSVAYTYSLIFGRG